ncbi:hypothetical protein BGZ57DRAFT_914124 [Hyaloscypha finlandica]|nr:hypothetical protein BGZ57DRAFT_914124 [Hyaloscypha finlandica]
MNDHPEIWNRYRRPYLDGTQYGTEMEGGSGTIFWEYPAEFHNRDLLDWTISNSPGFGLLGQETNIFEAIVLSVASAIYGSIHIAGWNEYFPSSGEQLWWRFSSIIVTVSGLLWKTAVPLSARGYHHLTWWNCIPSSVAMVAMLGIIVGYPIARAFLLVESLYSLRKLPVAVYQTPVWTNYLKHL